MAIFKFSAFADEYATGFDEQIYGLLSNDIHMIEIRSVDGKNIGDLTEKKILEVKEKLDKAQIKVSALGSPIGKINIDDDFKPHLKKLEKLCKFANILETDKIRIFSFYIPEDKDFDEYQDEVFKKLEFMIELADKYGILLCHENEKGIFGNSPDRCLRIHEHFGNKLGCIFDACNYVQSGYDSFPDGFYKLYPYITYFHIKDCKKDGFVLPPGYGICGLPEILAYTNRNRKDEVILSIEPHLMDFGGLKTLEHGNEKSLIANRYSSNEESFNDAVMKARNILPRNV